MYYNDQLVHHSDSDANKKKWTQRYYQSETYFRGAGNPILLILGGEGAIEPEEGLLYPFIVNEGKGICISSLITSMIKFYFQLSTKSQER